MGRENEQAATFNWRRYAKHPENMPEELAARMDTLSEMINDGSEDGQRFLADVRAGNMLKPLTTFVQYFRGTLSSEESMELYKTLEKCEEQSTWRVTK